MWYGKIISSLFFLLFAIYWFPDVILAYPEVYLKSLVGYERQVVATWIFLGDMAISLFLGTLICYKLGYYKNTLSIWINYRQIAQQLRNLGLESIIIAIEKGVMPVDEIVKNFKYNFYHTLLKNIFKENDIFNKFNRLSHEQTIKIFKELDLKLIELNRQKEIGRASCRERVSSPV